MKYSLILVFVGLYFNSMVAQKPFIYSEKGALLNTDFEKTFGPFLKKHAFTYSKHESSPTSIKDVRAHFVKRTREKGFKDIDFCKSLRCESPLSSSFYQFHFKHLDIAKQVEKKLKAYDGDINTSKVPDPFLFIRRYKTIFLISYYVHDKTGEATLKALKTYLDNLK